MPEAGHGSARSHLRTAAVVLLVLVAVLPALHRLTWSPDELVNGFVPDDAFYYYKIAINIRSGHGSTFDGLNETNGYHPAWMLVCVALAFVSTEPSAYLRLVLGANVVVLVLLCLQLHRMFRATLGLPLLGLLLVLVLGNSISGTALSSGLETGLALLLLLASVERAVRGPLARTRDGMMLGLLFALAFLARTDFALGLPVLLGVVIWRLRAAPPTVAARPLAALLGALALGALPYLAWNLHVTGQLQQISGLVKSARNDGALSSVAELLGGVSSVANLLVLALSPVAFHAKMAIPGFGAIGKGFVVLLAFVVPAHLLWKRSRGRGAGDGQLLVMAGLSAIFAGYYVTAYGDDIRPWHLTVAVVTLQCAFVHAVRDGMTSTRGALRVALGAVALCLAAGYALQTFAYRTLYQHVHYRFIAPLAYSHEVVRWISEHVEPDETIGAWNAGYLGYFSGRKVVNLDGLVNGVTLYEYIRRGEGAWAYIVDERLDYVSDYFFGPPLPERSVIADRLERVYNVGCSAVERDDVWTYVDWYVWRVTEEDATRSTIAERPIAPTGR